MIIKIKRSLTSVFFVYSQLAEMHLFNFRSNIVCLYVIILVSGTLIFISLWADSQTTMIFSYFFSRKQTSTFHANCLIRRQFAWNVSQFSGKNKKAISKYLYCLLKFLPSMLNIADSVTLLVRKHIQQTFSEYFITTVNPARICPYWPISQLHCSSRMPTLPQDSPDFNFLSAGSLPTWQTTFGPIECMMTYIMLGHQSTPRKLVHTQWIWKK